MLGEHIAELDLPERVAVWPFSGRPNHVTLFGDPDDVLRHVVRVLRA